MNPQDIMQHYVDVLKKINQQDTQAAMDSDGQKRSVQIKDLVDKDTKAIANQPSEQYADIDAVTKDAGGGVNGPKDPSAFRADSAPLSFRAYYDSITANNDKDN